ncbi:MAG: trigger factor [Patescibacteria group bacterium]
MNISVTKLPKSEIELLFEISVEEFEKHIDQAIKNLGVNIEAPGFRKGNAPKEIVEKQIGEEKILFAAADLAIQENYIKALDEKGIEVVASPKIEIVKLAKDNPFEFKATTAVLPEIELPSYKEIVGKLKKKSVEVTKEEIEKIRKEKEKWEIEKLRQEMLEKIAEKAKIEIPETLLEQEKLRMLENFKKGVTGNLQIGFEEYLKKVGKTEKEILDSFSSEVEKRVKTSLVLREIGKLEKIEVTEKEIDEDIKKSPAPNVQSEQMRNYTKEVLRHEKTFQLLEGFLRN